MKSRLLTSYLATGKDIARYSIKTESKHWQDIKRFTLSAVDGLPRYLKRKLLRQYVVIFNKKLPKQNELFANIWLRETVKHVRPIIDNCPFKNLKALRRDEIVREYAEQCADMCLNIIANYGAPHD